MRGHHPHFLSRRLTLWADSCSPRGLLGPVSTTVCGTVRDRPPTWPVLTHITNIQLPVSTAGKRGLTYLWGLLNPRPAQCHLMPMNARGRGWPRLEAVNGERQGTCWVGAPAGPGCGWAPETPASSALAWRGISRICSRHQAAAPSPPLEGPYRPPPPSEGWPELLVS